MAHDKGWVAMKLDPIGEDHLKFLKIKNLTNLNDKRYLTWRYRTEFARHQDLAQFLQVETFFCDTYASWQKGGIENMNGRFRRDLPRSTNLKALPDAELEQIVLNHNMTPRKCLNALSPIEALAKHMGKDIIFSFNKGVALHLWMYPLWKYIFQKKQAGPISGSL